MSALPFQVAALGQAIGAILIDPVLDVVAQRVCERAGWSGHDSVGDHAHHDVAVAMDHHPRTPRHGIVDRSDRGLCRNRAIDQLVARRIEA